MRRFTILTSAAITLAAIGCGDDGEGATAAGREPAGSSMMGASQACQTCVANLYGNDAACAANIQSCDDDPDCNSWKDCSEQCFADDDSVECYEACDAQHPHDTSLSAPLLACTCNACGDVCVASCAGR